MPGAAAAWLSAGWGVGAGTTAVLLLAAVAVGGAVVVLARSRRGRGEHGALVALPLLAAAVVLMSVAGQLSVRAAGVLPDLVERRASVRAEAVVTADPRPVRQDSGDESEAARPVWRTAEGRFVVRLAVHAVTGRGVRGETRAEVLVVGDERWARLRPGEAVMARGRLAAADPGERVVAVLFPTAGPLLTSPAGGVHRRAEFLRVGLREAAEPLPADSRGLLPGLVVGDTSRLPVDLEEAMRTAGLTHLTAVSGSNVAIVCGTALLVAAACGAGRRTRISMAAAALAGFVVLARPEPSVLRAGVMGAIGLTGLAAARRGRGMPALCAAVLLLTVIDPWLGRSFGFALSVLATAGLLLVAPPWADTLSRVLPRPVAQAVAVPAAAQAVCAPVIVLISPELSLVAVPANLLVAPAVAPATVLGVLATVLAPLSPQGAQGVAWLAAWATGWIAGVARTAAAVPWSSVAWPEGRSGALLLASLTLLVVVLLPVLLRTVRAGSRRVHASSGRVVGGLAAALVLVVAATVFSAPGSLLGRGGAVSWPGAGWPPAGWHAVACDVGQGDALVVSTGPGAAIVVDAGSEPDVVERCLRRLGVHTVDVLILSHFHADHAGGLAGVLAGRAVLRALVSPVEEPARQAAQALEVLRGAGVPVVVGTAGQTGQVGPVRWQVVWPDPARLSAGDAGTAAEGESSGANDASLVVLFERPELRLLATGDIEPTAQAPLRRALAHTGDAVPVDVLKVAHHGSARQDRELHRLLSPRLALISAGKGNDYGHPSPATITLLREQGAMVARTDQLGDVAVGGDSRRVDAHGLWVAGRRQRPDQAVAASGRDSGHLLGWAVSTS